MIHAVLLGDLGPWLGVSGGVLSVRLAVCRRSVGGLLVSWWWCAQGVSWWNWWRMHFLSGVGPGFRGNVFHRSGPRWQLGQAGARRGWRRGHCCLCAGLPDRAAGTKGLGHGAKNCPSGVSMGYSVFITIERLLEETIERSFEDSLGTHCSLLGVHSSIHLLTVHY